MNLYSGLLSNKMPEKVLNLFEQMNIEPDEVTLTSLLNACGQINDNRAKKIGKEILNKMPKHFQKSSYIQNSAINMLMKLGDVQHAERLFEMMKKKNIITYGAMMKGKLKKRVLSKIGRIVYIKDMWKTI